MLWMIFTNYFMIENKFHIIKKMGDKRCVWKIYNIFYFLYSIFIFIYYMHNFKDNFFRMGTFRQYGKFNHQLRKVLFSLIFVLKNITLTAKKVNIDKYNCQLGKRNLRVLFFLEISFICFTFKSILQCIF